MHALQLALDQVRGLRDDIFRLSEQMHSNPVQIGLILDLNPIWLFAHTLSESGLREELMAGRPFGPGIWDMVDALPSLRGALDLGRQHEVADEITGWIFGPRKTDYTPFMVKLIACPIEENSPRLFEARSRLAALAREAPFPAMVETRSLPRLLADPGNGLQGGAGARGTLGGFLKDVLTGELFAATCGHVVSSGQVSVAGRSLGPCKHARSPLPLPQGLRCSAQCAIMTRLDLALIAVPAGAGQNTATSVASVIYSKDLVAMNGATSGCQQYEVGGYGITYEVGGSCWEGVFELRPIIRSGVVPAGLQVMLTTLPNDGDSGAWVIRNASEWCGVVVAADYQCGYALPAQLVLTEADSAFGLKLALV